MPTMNLNNLTDSIANAVNGAAVLTAMSEPDRTALEAQLAAMRAENARLKTEEQAAAQKKAQIQASKVLAPASKVAGTYPDNATPKDRLLLDAIHKCKDTKVLQGYTIPPAYGPALFHYFHQALKAKYPPTTKPDGKPDWKQADAVIMAAVDDACQRGIVTRKWGGKVAMYFDAREQAPSSSDSRTPSAAAVNAIAEVF